VVTWLHLQLRRAGHRRLFIPASAHRWGFPPLTARHKFVQLDPHNLQVAGIHSLGSVHIMAVVVIWTDDDPVVDSGPDLFSLAVKAPAGVVAPDPEFTLYLGTNTGPYKTADNGSVILPPIPIEWIIAPRNVTVGQCPSSTDNLQLFGVTNAIVLALALVLGCRPLLRYVTRGLLGKPSRYSWIWTWIISCGLQVASNAIVSHLIITTPGYEHLSMVNVFALYSSRPRINQLWMAILRLFVGPIYFEGYLAFLRPPTQDRGTTVWQRLRRYFAFLRRTTKAETSTTTVETPTTKSETPTTKAETPTTQNQGTAAAPSPADLRYQYKEYVDWQSRLAAQKTKPVAQKTQPAAQQIIPAAQETQITDREDIYWRYSPEWVYTDSYVTTCIAELILHIISAVFIGVTWRRFPNVPIREYMKSDVNLMIAAPAVALFSWVCVPIWVPRRKGILEDVESSARRLTLFVLILIIPAFFTYGVAWKYWRDFLQLPGSL
jgi:hypothetical protein